MYTIFYTTCPDNKQALKLLKDYGKYDKSHSFDYIYNGRKNTTDIVYCYDCIDRAESDSPVYFFRKFSEEDVYTLVCLDTDKQRNFIGAL